MAPTGAALQISLYANTMTVKAFNSIQFNPQNTHVTHKVTQYAMPHNDKIHTYRYSHHLTHKVTKLMSHHAMSTTSQQNTRHIGGFNLYGESKNTHWDMSFGLEKFTAAY